MPSKTRASLLASYGYQSPVSHVHRFKVALAHLNSIHWVSSMICRLVLGKMWIRAHHPFSFPKEQQITSDELGQRLFITSVEVLECSYLLKQNRDTARWTWLFRNYMQWHAITFVLLELCICPPGPECSRAWKAVENVYRDRVLENSNNEKGMLWRPVRQLMAKAQVHRNELMMGRKLGCTDMSQFQQSDFASCMQPPTDGLGRYQMSTTQYDALGSTLDLDAEGGDMNLVFPQGELIPGLERPQYDFGEFLAKEQTTQENVDFLNWTGWPSGLGDFTMDSAPPTIDCAGLRQQQGSLLWP